MSERQNGTVKFFNDQKGFGFIAPEGGGKDIFVHATALARSSPQIETLAEGDRVSFDTEDGTKGPRAVQLTVL